MKTKNVIDTKKFKLADNPVDYILSVHVRNLMATYGEEKVKSSIKELFFAEVKTKKVKKAVGQ